MNIIAIYIVSIIVFLIIMFILKKFVKWAFRIVSIIFLISFILSSLLGFFVYKDLSDLRQNWPESDKIVLLANDKVYAGMITTFGEDKEPVLIGDVDRYQILYQNKDYQSILGATYRLFIFRLSMFEKSEKELDFGDAKLSQKTVIEAIESDDSIEFIANNLAEKGEIDSKEDWKSEAIEEIGKETEFKGLLFGMLLQDEMTKDPLFIFKQYSKGNVVIYPETVTFKLIKAVPFSLIEGIVGGKMPQ